MFSTEEAPAQGVSAVKALALAAAAGQKVYEYLPWYSPCGPAKAVQNHS